MYTTSATCLRVPECMLKSMQAVCTWTGLQHADCIAEHVSSSSVVWVCKQGHHMRVHARMCAGVNARYALALAATYKLTASMYPPIRCVWVWYPRYNRDKWNTKKRHWLKYFMTGKMGMRWIYLQRRLLQNICDHSWSELIYIISLNFDLLFRNK